MLAEKRCTGKRTVSQGLKPVEFLSGFGMTEVVPCYRASFERPVSQSMMRWPLYEASFERPVSQSMMGWPCYEVSFERRVSQPMVRWLHSAFASRILFTRKLVRSLRWWSGAASELRIGSSIRTEAVVFARFQAPGRALRCRTRWWRWGPAGPASGW